MRVLKMYMNRILLIVVTAMGVFSQSSWAVTGPQLQGLAAKSEITPRERVVDAVIEAVQRTTVSAQTSGRIVEVNVDVDDFVNKGDVIVRLRDREQRSALNSAAAKAREGRANFERVEELYAKKSVSKSEYDRARAAAEAALAAQEQAQEQLDNTVIRAPYAGIVVTRHVEMGESVSTGKPIMTGISLEKLRAVANVPQMNIDSIRGLSSAWVILPTQKGRRIQGEKLTISPYADPATHTFKVRVDLPDGIDGLYPGIYSKVVFIVGEEQRVLIPSHSVVYRGEVTGVYVLNGSAISLRQIRVGRTFASGQIEVLAGLDEGEIVAQDPILAGIALKEMRNTGLTKEKPTGEVSK